MHVKQTCLVAQFNIIKMMLSTLPTARCIFMMAPTTTESGVAGNSKAMVSTPMLTAVVMKGSGAQARKMVTASTRMRVTGNALSTVGARVTCTMANGHCTNGTGLPFTHGRIKVNLTVCGLKVSARNGMI